MELAQPWHRWASETDLAFSAFVAYLAMGWPQGLGGLPRVRTISAMARSTQHDPSWLRDCLHTYSWRERAMAYDAAVHRARDSAEFDTAYDARKAHLDLIQRASVVLRNELDKALEASQGEGTQLPAKALFGALSDLVKLDRLVRGESTENVRHTDELDLSGLTADEALALSELLSKAQRR